MKKKKGLTMVYSSTHSQHRGMVYEHNNSRELFLNSPRTFKAIASSPIQIAKRYFFIIIIIARSRLGLTINLLIKIAFFQTKMALLILSVGFMNKGDDSLPVLDILEAQKNSSFLSHNYINFNSS